jgi:hypothetical protein
MANLAPSHRARPRLYSLHGFRLGSIASSGAEPGRLEFRGKFRGGFGHPREATVKDGIDRPKAAPYAPLSG